jgi:hypothetical protein
MHSLAIHRWTPNPELEGFLAHLKESKLACDATSNPQP